MVLVCQDPAFVFLKTTKTAGTSAEMALQSYCVPPGQTVLEDTETLETGYGIVGARGRKHVIQKAPRWKIWHDRGWYNHMPASAVRKKLGAARFDAATKITSVRNPFDRMVSYFHFQKPEISKTAGDFADIKAQFRDDVLAEEWSDDFWIIEIDGQNVIDHIVRTEHIAEDLRAVTNALELDPARLSLPHTKDRRSHRKGHAVHEYFDPDTIAVIRRRMAWVFDLTDYPDAPIPSPETPQSAALEKVEEQVTP